jgi:YwiC-like protein
MAEHVAELPGSPARSNSRLRYLIIPREHGAWGMLLVPLATGASVGLLTGGNAWFLPFLVIATLTIFWMRTPVESWLGSSPLRAQSREERSAVWRVILLLAAVTGLSLIALFWVGQHWQLLWLGALAALSFVGQAILKKLSRRTRMAAQIVGAIGLTSTAPAAYCVVAGRINALALLLWLTNWLFAVNQIQFVQLRIHSARTAGIIAKVAQGRTFLIVQSAVAIILFVAWRIRMLPWLVLLAFAPALVRSLAWFLRSSGPLVVRRLGWTELVHAVSFGILLVMSFALPV